MGRHDADPRERLRYVIVALVVIAVIALLVVGVFAGTDLAGH
ncbi:MAG: hypothetical protein ABJB47_06590 [Actinomycetota bacterium]